MTETLRVGRPVKIEKCPDRRQDGGHDERRARLQRWFRRPLPTVSAPPPGYPVGPPPAWVPPPAYGPPPGYGPPPAFGPPPGYGFPPGYGPPPGSQYGPPHPVPGAVKPGIIPLRPLTLSDIFNGAVGYIRANPKATLGLTAMVVVVIHIITLIATVGPLAALGRTTTEQPDELTAGAVGAWLASLAAGLLVSWLGGMLLSGMLTVIVGRADRKSTRLNSSHRLTSRMPSSA